MARTGLPNSGLANVRLHSSACISLEVEQTGGRTDKHGQFVLDLNESCPSADDLFAEAQSAERGWRYCRSRTPLFQRTVQRHSISETCSRPTAAAEA